LVRGRVNKVKATSIRIYKNSLKVQGQEAPKMIKRRSPKHGSIYSHKDGDSSDKEHPNLEDDKSQGQERIASDGNPVILHHLINHVDASSSGNPNSPLLALISIPINTRKTKMFLALIFKLRFVIGIGSLQELA
jgi:hypothetical protein